MILTPYSKIERVVVAYMRNWRWFCIIKMSIESSAS